MARIRSVKPEICESETMARCSAEVERTFVRLWTHLDDHGRAKDHPTLIKAALFPLHDEVTAAVVDEHLWTLASEGLIVRYEVDGKAVLACPSWAEHQHPQKPRASKFPAPEQGVIRTEPDGSGSHTVPVPEPYGPVEVVGEVEVGVVVVEDPTPLAAPMPGTGLALVADAPAPATPSQRYSTEFETWWAEYPRKVEKAPAAKAYAAARRTTSAETLLEAVRAHAAAWAAAGTETSFILYPERWLKRRRYDEAPEAAAPRATNSRSGANADKIRRSLDRMTGGQVL